MLQDKIRQLHSGVTPSAYTQHKQEIKKFKHDRWPVQVYDMVRR